MSTLRKFELPLRSDRFDESLKLRLEEARTSGGARETVTVDRNGKALHVDVIDLPLDELFLNPATHRIRAQCGHDPERQRALDADPWGREGQDYLSFLLKATPADPDKRDPDFEKLKEDLKKYGQNEPGLITREGIIVNGNTRAAALRELQFPTMRAGVLPASFTWDDITAVELSLQLRNDSRREYSYINRLLAVEERTRLGLSSEAIAREFRVMPKTVAQYVWILQLIRDLIERSRSGGASLRLVDFEGMQERLKELHRDYSNLSKSDPDGAEALREFRTSAMLLGFAKTDVRWITEKFHDSYLSKFLPENLAPKAVGTPQSGVTIPGLGIAMPAVSTGVDVARNISQRVLETKAQAASGQADENQRRAASEVQRQVKDAFDQALDQAGRDGRLRKRKQLAPERLKEAAASLELCIGEMVKAKGSRAFDEQDFDDAVVQFRTVFQQLASQAGRGNDDPGVGVSWLLKAAAIQEERE